MKRLMDLVAPLMCVLALLALMLFGLHLYRQSGYDEGYAAAKALGDTAVSKMKAEYAEEKRVTAENAVKAADLAIEKIRNEQALGNQLASQLADTKADLRRTTEKLTGEIAHVTRLYRRALNSPPEPLPVAVFTHGFVRVWNSANGISTSLPTQPATIGTDTSSRPTGAADDLDSGITQDQLLNNQVRNGELYASCRAQLNRLIDWTLNASK